MKPQTGRRYAFLLIVTLAAVSIALVVVGCGGGDEESVASAEDAAQTTTTAREGSNEKDQEQAMLDFAQCVRDNGVPEFRDPVLNEEGGFKFARPPAGTDRDAVLRAMQSCGDILTDAGVSFGAQDEESQAERQDALLAFARCMRGEGFDVPDPDSNTGLANVRKALEDIDRNSPKFQRAFEKCQEKLAGAGGPFGGGGSSG
jgi:hypothetical protein